MENANNNSDKNVNLNDTSRNTNNEASTMINGKEYKETFGVELLKEFKFNSSHFVIYEGFREPLHGHNYKVSVKITCEKLGSEGYVIDFGDVKTIVTDICKNLKHCLLIPKFNPMLEIIEQGDNTEIRCKDGAIFKFPSKDLKIIETTQISAECLSKYITLQFLSKLKTQCRKIFDLNLKKIKIKVYEDAGKCGIYSLTSF